MRPFRTILFSRTPLEGSLGRTRCRHIASERLPTFFTEWAPQLKRLPAVLSKLLAVQCNVRWPLRSVITSAQHRSISSDIERQNGAIAPSYGAIEVGPNMYSEFDSSAP